MNRQFIENTNDSRAYEKMLNLTKKKKEGRGENCKLKLHCDTIFPIRLAKIQKVNNTLCWQGCEDIGILKHCW